MALRRTLQSQNKGAQLFGTVAVMWSLRVFPDSESKNMIARCMSLKSQSLLTIALHVFIQGIKVGDRVYN